MNEQQFNNTLLKVAKHVGLLPTEQTVGECDKKNAWTPTDLILREYYNNGGGSAKGFLGITMNTCIQAYNYIKEHQNELVSKDYINKDGYNNSGFPLWKDYIIY